MNAVEIIEHLTLEKFTSFSELDIDIVYVKFREGSIIIHGKSDQTKTLPLRAKTWCFKCAEDRFATFLVDHGDSAVLLGKSRFILKKIVKKTAENENTLFFPDYDFKVVELSDLNVSKYESFLKGKPYEKDDVHLQLLPSQTLITKFGDK